MCILEIGTGKRYGDNSTHDTYLRWRVTCVSPRPRYTIHVYHVAISFCRHSIEYTGYLLKFTVWRYRCDDRFFQNPFEIRNHVLSLIKDNKSYRDNRKYALYPHTSHMYVGTWVRGFNLHDWNSITVGVWIWLDVFTWLVHLYYVEIQIEFSKRWKQKCAQRERLNPSSTLCIAYTYNLWVYM